MFIKYHLNPFGTASWQEHPKHPFFKQNAFFCYQWLYKIKYPFCERENTCIKLKTFYVIFSITFNVWLTLKFMHNISNKWNKQMDTILPFFSKFRTHAWRMTPFLESPPFFSGGGGGGGRCVCVGVGGGGGGGGNQRVNFLIKNQIFAQVHGIAVVYVLSAFFFFFFFLGGGVSIYLQEKRNCISAQFHGQISSFFFPCCVRRCRGVTNQVWVLSLTLINPCDFLFRWKLRWDIRVLIWRLVPGTHFTKPL